MPNVEFGYMAEKIHIDFLGCGRDDYLFGQSLWWFG
jgi:hypothetical protein